MLVCHLARPSAFLPFPASPGDSLGCPHPERTLCPCASISSMTQEQDSGPEGSWVIRGPGRACVWRRARRPTPTGGAGARPPCRPARAPAPSSPCVSTGVTDPVLAGLGGAAARPVTCAVLGSTAGSSSQHFGLNPPHPWATGGQGPTEAGRVRAHRAGTRECVDVHTCERACTLHGECECVGVPTCACAHLERLHEHTHVRAHTAPSSPVETGFLNRQLRPQCRARTRLGEGGVGSPLPRLASDA